MMSGEIESLLNGARAARTAGHLADARRGYERAGELARTAGNTRLLAHALRHMSDIEREDGRPVEALASGREAVELYRELAGTSSLELANALRVTSLALQGVGEIGEVSSLWREARSLYMQAGIQAGVEECDANLSRIGAPGHSQ